MYSYLLEPSKSLKISLKAIRTIRTLNNLNTIKTLRTLKPLKTLKGHFILTAWSTEHGARSKEHG